MDVLPADFVMSAVRSDFKRCLPMRDDRVEVFGGATKSPENCLNRTSFSSNLNLQLSV